MSAITVKLVGLELLPSYGRQLPATAKVALDFDGQIVQINIWETFRRRLGIYTKRRRDAIWETRPKSLTVERDGMSLNINQAELTAWADRAARYLEDNKPTPPPRTNPAKRTGEILERIRQRLGDGSIEHLRQEKSRGGVWQIIWRTTEGQFQWEEIGQRKLGPKQMENLRRQLNVQYLL